MPDGLMMLLQKSGVAVTRENYILMNYGDDLPEWTSEHEAELPEELQDWSRFQVEGNELVLKPGVAAI